MIFFYRRGAEALTKFKVKQNFLRLRVSAVLMDNFYDNSSYPLLIVSPSN
jgi:hypothetical protein